MMHIVMDFQDAKKIQNKELRPRITVFEPKQVISFVRSMFTIQSEIQNITFEVRVVKSNLLKTPIKRLKKLKLLQPS